MPAAIKKLNIFSECKTKSTTSLAKTLSLAAASLLLFLSHFSQTNADVFFSNDCKRNIIHQINKTNNEILIAVYSIDDPNIAKSILNFVARGGKVRIITDRVQAANKNAKAPLLHETLKPMVKVNNNTFRIMHEKIAIFISEYPDPANKNKKIVTEKAILGSFNWTCSAAHKNAENCILIESDQQEELNKLKARFEYMWQLFSSEDAEEYFKKLKYNKEVKEAVEKIDTKDLESIPVNNTGEKKLALCDSRCRKKCLVSTKKKFRNLDLDTILSGSDITTDKQEAKAVIFYGKCQNKCPMKCKKKYLISKKKSKYKQEEQQ